MNVVATNPYAATCTTDETLETAALPPCYSIHLENNRFDTFNFLKEVITDANFVSASSGMQHRGIVLTLDNFPGDVTIYNNLFLNNKLYYDSCDTAAAMDAGVFAGTDMYQSYGSKTVL